MEGESPELPSHWSESMAPGAGGGLTDGVVTEPRSAAWGGSGWTAECAAGSDTSAEYQSHALPQKTN